MVNKEHQRIKKENTRRVILNVPLELDDTFQEFSLKRGIAKSQMILYAMSWFSDYKQSLDLMPIIIKSFKNVEDFAKSKKSKNSDKC